jgi:uncharacterized protein (TIGR03437 family)
VGLTVQAGSAVPIITAVVNAASFQPGLVPGALETITGVNLTGGQTATANSTWPMQLAGVTVNLAGSPVPLLYASDGQINFYAPSNLAAGTTNLTVTNAAGAQASTPVATSANQPGIFVIVSPVHAGGFIEIWCTGLGPVQASASLQRTVTLPTVFIGGVPVTPSFSGLAPGYVGLYQVNAQVPSSLAPGTYSVLISQNLAHSNTFNITVQ